MLSGQTVTQVRNCTSTPELRKNNQLIINVLVCVSESGSMNLHQFQTCWSPDSTTNVLFVFLSKFENGYFFVDIVFNYCIKALRRRWTKHVITHKPAEVNGGLFKLF